MSLPREYPVHTSLQSWVAKFREYCRMQSYCTSETFPPMRVTFISEYTRISLLPSLTSFEGGPRMPSTLSLDWPMEIVFGCAGS